MANANDAVDANDEAAQPDIKSVTPPTSAALRHDADDLPWPQRPWIMAAICAVAGAIFNLLVDNGSVSPLRQAAGVFVVISSIAFVLTVELRRWQWSLIFALGWGLVIAGVGYYTAQYNRNGEIVEFPFLAAIFAVLLAAPLFQAARDMGRREFPYMRTHNHIWNDAVIGAASLLFTGVTFLLVHLLAELFMLVGISFLRDLLDSDTFGFFLAGAAFGGAVGILRERDALVGTMQRLVMVVLSVLAPVLAVGLLVFLASLPFTGLQPLWDSTKATTPILLSCAAGAFILANVVIGNGAEDRMDNRILQRAALALALCILPLAIIAAISSGLRIQQYGWTPSRIWAAIVVFVALAYGVSYLWAVFKGRTHWDDLARQWNLRGAIALVAMAIFLALPIIDFGSISARDQVARLKSGQVPAHKFDYAAMAYDFGPKGRALLKSLSTNSNEKVAVLAKEALAANNRWDIARYQQGADQDIRPLEERLVVVGAAPAATEKAILLKALRSTNFCRYEICTARKVDQESWLVTGKRYDDKGEELVLLKRSGPPRTKGEALEDNGNDSDGYWSADNLSLNEDTIYRLFRESGRTGAPVITEEDHNLGHAKDAIVEWKPAPRQQLYINGRPTYEYDDE